MMREQVLWSLSRGGTHVADHYLPASPTPAGPSCLSLGVQEIFPSFTGAPHPCSHPIHYIDTKTGLQRQGDAPIPSSQGTPPAHSAGSSLGHHEVVPTHCVLAWTFSVPLPQWGAKCLGPGCGAHGRTLPQGHGHRIQSWCPGGKFVRQISETQKCHSKEKGEKGEW